jgi:Leucine-rich repeat (LRR) protein
VVRRVPITADSNSGREEQPTQFPVEPSKIESLKPSIGCGHYSHFTRAMDSNVYKLLNLMTLFLEQNELTNVDAIGEYKFLERVALSKNAFRGSNLKNLKTLYLHTNAWTR